MRSLHRTLLVGVLAVLAGCSKSSSPTSGPTTTTIPMDGRFGYQLNGTTVLSKNILTSSAQAVYQQNYGLGVDTTTHLLTITISSFQSIGLSFHSTEILLAVPMHGPSTGVFPIVHGNPTSADASYLPDTLSYAPTAGGKITITKFDTVRNLVSGYFQFDASQDGPIANPNNVISLTNGFFNDVGLTVGAFDQGSVSGSFGTENFAFSSEEVSQLGCIYQQLDGAVTIIGEQLNGQQTTMLMLGVVNPVAGQTYSFSGPTPGASATLNISGDPQAANNGSFTATDGSVYIASYDTLNRRFSGTFLFDGTDTQSQQTISVTNGVITNVQWAVVKPKEADRHRSN